ncbi:MAG: Hpt domain-containing protein [Porticoccaceae bacterium]
MAQVQDLQSVVIEIESGLATASQALAGFGDGSDGGNDSDKLDVCLEAVRRVQGLLADLQCASGALLVEDAATLLEALRDGRVSQPSEACDALHHTFRVMPVYLGDIRAGGSGTLWTAIALLNELRAARGEPLASDMALFSPALASVGAIPAGLPRLVLDQRAWTDLVKKLSQIYQYAVLAVLKGQDAEKHGVNLIKVFVRLQELCRGGREEQLWRVAAAFVETIAHQAAPLRAATRQLLWGLDRELRHFAQQGPDAFSAALPDSLLKNLLFYVASAGAELPRGKSVAESYQLAGALPEGLLDAGAGRLQLHYEGAVTAALSAAITLELSAIHAGVEHYLSARASDATVGELKRDLTLGLQRAADALALVGQVPLRQRVRALAENLAVVLNAAQPSTGEGIAGITDRIIDIEAALLAWVPEDQSTSAVTNAISMAAVDIPEQSPVEAARGVLTIIRAALSAGMASGDVSVLAGTPLLARDICNKLALSGHARAAQIMAACGDSVGEFAAAKATPSGSLALAAALARLDDYLAAMDGGEEMGGERLLDQADELLRQHLETTAELEVASAEPEDQLPESEDDAEFRQIFVEEACEVLADLVENTPRWGANQDSAEAMTDIRRGFHTLKGSGRMVGATTIAKLAWPIEEMINKVLERRVAATNDMITLVQQVLAVLPGLIDDFSHGRRSPRQELVDDLAAVATALAGGGVATIPVDAAETGLAGANPDDQSECSLTSQSRLDSAVAAPMPAADEAPESNLPAGETFVNATDVDARVGAHDLATIFCREAEIHLAAITAFVAARKYAPVLPPTAELQRALHTLKGSAATADVGSVVEMLEPLEQAVKECLHSQRTVDEDLIQLLGESIQACRAATDDLQRGGRGTSVAAGAFSARAEALLARLVGESPSAAARVNTSAFTALFAEGLVNIVAAEDMLSRWQAMPATGCPEVTAMMDELSELNQVAKQAHLTPIATLSEALAEVYDCFEDSSSGPGREVFDALVEGHRALLSMIDAVAAGQVVLPVSTPLIARLLKLSLTLSTEAADALSVRQDTAAVAGELQLPAPAEPEASSAEVDLTTPPGFPDAAVHASEPPSPPAMQSPANPASPLPEEEEFDEGVDPDILSIFLDEADELLEQVEKDIHTWREGGDRKSADALNRAMHTLKGGARMAGLRAFGDASHDFEARVLLVEQTGGAPSREFFQELLSRHDQLLAAVRHIRHPDTAAPNVAVAPSGGFAVGSTAVGPWSAVEPASIAEVTKFPAPAVSAAKKALPLDTPETVKMAAPVLDNLVNLASEASISRGRIGRQLSEFNFSLSEMDSTIARLHDQVRRLGIETEAQILFRREQLQSSDDAASFDPLELDRYSQLQQLTRALQESASDLDDLRETLMEKSHGAEALLIQQGSINSDLQESLMGTRMVPFSRLVPRLRRIVRQVGGELGKPVQLCLDRIDGEMDRAVLEKIVAPLEHMIRNSVDHGIEPLEQRRAAGKPEDGNLYLSFSREGGDTVIHFRDDGRGLDLPAIRAQAIARELMRAEDQVSDRALMEFIFRSGFSTSRQVSQVSGRGVGMDVVNEQVRELGGSIAIDSRRGVGTEFAIRLPFTLSINRALLIRHNDHSYALPLNTIQGVIRISGDELASYAANPEARLDYGGFSYRILSLTQVLKMGGKPFRATTRASLVLIEGDRHHWAVHVDRLEGSLDVVAKSLGPQFSGMLGLSGVTTLGDGRVVVVLDLPGLLRGQEPRSLVEPEVAVEATDDPGDASLDRDRVRTIMVVDDSVTVRKVTSRVLEREGFKVITAKDGVDAMRVLQDLTPDLMLLDIEMPRMDGFEVARQVRSSARLKTLPIIMVTSRTGEKHREKGLLSGVNTYLGKPYQEETLLATIHGLLQGEPVAV